MIAAHGHRERGQEGRHGQEGLPDPPDRAAEGLGRLVAQGQEVHVPGQPDRRNEAQDNPRGDRRDLAPFGELEAAEEPEDRLVVGIRAHEQEERGQGRGQRAGGDAGQEDGLDLEAAPPQGQGVDERDDAQAGEEGQEARAAEAEGGGLEAEGRRQDGPERGPRRDADHEGIGHRIAEVALEDGPGQGQRGADEEGQDGPGQAEIDEDGRMDAVGALDEAQQVAGRRLDRARSERRGESRPGIKAGHTAQKSRAAGLPAHARPPKCVRDGEGPAIRPEDVDEPRSEAAGRVLVELEDPARLRRP